MTGPSARDLPQREPSHPEHARGSSRRGPTATDLPARDADTPLELRPVTPPVTARDLTAPDQGTGQRRWN